jgi:hypothetical protein
MRACMYSRSFGPREALQNAGKHAGDARAPVALGAIALSG